MLSSVYKVSIIIPTYKTDPQGLSRLLQSLDAQTLSADEFEIIFVDDGSPDNTFERLQSEKAKRSNVSVTRIENSGWPSKPRNIGIKMAKGEYVLFMDHDDELYPDALRAGYEFAVRNNADALSGKESRTDDPAWAIGVYREDEPQAIGREGAHPLMPMNPHKLYRRKFVLKHKITFPEGRMVFWEDIFFNIQVARYAKVISRMASVPFYHWVTTEGSGTSLFDNQTEYYWEMLRKVCDFANENLSDPALIQQREQILRHQYRVRVLGPFNANFHQKSIESRKLIFSHAQCIRRDFEFERFDETLSVSQALRAWAVGEGRRDLVERLSQEDVAIAGWQTADTLAWSNGVLEISSSAQWSSAHGRTLSLRSEGNRVIKDLSPELEQELPAEQLDMTRDLAEVDCIFAVRSRDGLVTWEAPAEWTTSFDENQPSSVMLAGYTKARIDPATAAFGKPLETDHWDLQAKISIGNGSAHRNVRSAFPGSVSYVNGQLHLVYTTDGGTVALVPRGQQEAIRQLTPIRAGYDSDGLVQLDLDGTHDGDGEVTCTLGLDTSTSAKKNTFTGHPAILRISDGKASLHFRKTGPVMRVRIGDHAGRRPPFWTLFVAEDRVGLNVGQLPKIRTTAEYEHEEQAG
ncbi:Glycosyl transferase family 2 [Brevibacterium linens]|uniref:Glycosyl transferase family 2 n=1 Tax=Brevibacterium linens TaxID=1703 RepID=A0A2H1JGA6_BRELN|nr:Glycosyl transferase family 2 [Brevibacterium linens]